MKSLLPYLLWASLCLVNILIPAHATSNYRLSPPQAAVDAAVELVFTLPACVVLLANPADETHVIRREQNQIQVLLSTIATPCLPDTLPGPAQKLNLGGFAAGDYELHVFELSALNPFPADLQGITPNATLRLAVGSGFLPVPTLSVGGLLGLTIGLMLLAGAVLRRRAI